MPTPMPPSVLPPPRVAGGQPAGAGEPLAELFTRLHTSPDGLSARDAKERLARDGANVLAAHGSSLLGDIARRLVSPLALVLIVAGASAAALGEVGDAIIIVTVLALGSGIDSWQTFRSDRAVKRLQEQIAPTATVRRDGAWTGIPRRDVVVGDLVRLSAGDLVPADGRLVECRDLHVQQAALTGESLPAVKSAEEAPTSAGPDSPALVFAGTSVVSGTGAAIVLATGARTAFGHVVARLAERPEETEFERGTRLFGSLIMRTVFFLVLFIMTVSLVLRRDPFESLLFAVALAVGMTPEFLPMITTVTLARGAVRMARRKVIVKHLSGIQNLGSIDVLCSDKTGTLTSGTMSVDSTLDPAGRSSERPLFYAGLDSCLATGSKSALDDAIRERCTADPRYRKTDEIPFDFERRRTSVVVEEAGTYRMIVKGAPESVLAACTRVDAGGEQVPLDASAREQAERTFRRVSEAGARCLAIAYRSVSKRAGFRVEDERDLVLAGFVTFADPPLDGVTESIRSLRADGVVVKILSGDNELVTRHVCEHVGIDATTMVLGTDIEHLDEPALARVAERASVFARVSPAQKHRIVKALRHHGHVVGFLGDGINDAPSLHGADVGISVANAADIAKEASDIVLLERRLDVLHAGIIEGRRACGNVLKYLLMGTSSNFGNMFSMAGAVLFLPFLPMLPSQLLLNSFLYDLAQITIPTDRVDPAYVRRPQRWDMRVIRNFMLVAGPVSSLFDVLTFVVLLAVLRFDETSFHTGWFVESLATQTLVLFVIRTLARPWAERPSAPLVITTVLVVGIGLALPYSPLAPLLGMRPLPLAFYGFLAAVVATYLFIMELVKEKVLRRLVTAPRAPSRA